MKIQSINNYNLPTRKNNINHQSFGSFRLYDNINNMDLFSFSQKEDGLSDVKSLTSDIKKEYKEICKNSKQVYKEYKKIIKTGQKHYFEGAVPYLPIANIKATFDRIDESSNLPSEITLWKDSKEIASYKLLNDKNKPIIQYDDFSKPGVTTSMVVSDKNLVHYTEIDERANRMKQFASCGSGFVYYENKIYNNKKNEDSEIEYAHNAYNSGIYYLSKKSGSKQESQCYICDSKTKNWTKTF